MGKRRFRMIDGSQLCNPEHQVGYCWCDLHPGFLSKSLLKQHECCERECRHFEKFQDAPYWQRKQEIKEKRLEAKRRAQYIKSISESMLCDINEALKNNENMALLGIEHKDATYILRFVCINRCDTHDLVWHLARKYKVRIKTQLVQNTYEFRKKLLEQKRGIKI